MNENKIIASLCIIGLLICSVVYFTQNKTSDVQEAPDINIDISIAIPEAEVSSTQPIVKVEKEDEGFVGGGTSHWSGDIEAVNITATGDLAVTDDMTVTDDFTCNGLIKNPALFSQDLGAKTAVATSVAQVLTNAEICNYSLIPIQPIQSINVTLPATSTLTSCLTTSGQTMDLVIENTATTTMNLTLVAGAGMDLQEPDGQNVVIGQNNVAWLKFVKLADGNVVVRTDETIPGD